MLFSWFHISSTYPKCSVYSSCISCTTNLIIYEISQQILTWIQIKFLHVISVFSVSPSPNPHASCRRGLLYANFIHIGGVGFPAKMDRPRYYFEIDMMVRLQFWSMSHVDYPFIAITLKFTFIRVGCTS